MHFYVKSFWFSQERYMHTARLISAQPVTFWPNHDPDGTFCSPTKFVLFYHQQIQQPGIVVNIRSLSNDCFLSVDHHKSRIVANSHTAPDNKFLIIPADEQWTCSSRQMAMSSGWSFRFAWKILSHFHFGNLLVYLSNTVYFCFNR
jgi:hypothetical protein